LADVVIALRATNAALVATGFLSVMLTNLAKAERWRLLFRTRHGHVRLKSCFAATMVGQMFNILVPGRIGELARAYVLGEAEGESKAYALGTIVIEKLVDVVMLGLVSGLLVWLVVLPGWFRGPGLLTALAASVLLIAIVSTTSWKARFLVDIKHWISQLTAARRWHWARPIEQGISGLGGLSSPGILALVILWSLVIWWFMGFTNLIILQAIGVGLPAISAWVVLVMLQAGVAVPSSPGKVGVFQYLCVLALSIFGVERAAALTYGLVLQAVVFLPPVLLGAGFVWWGNLRWREVQRIEREVEASGEGAN